MGFKIFPDPQSGDPKDYGAFGWQKQVRWQALPESERPHLHYVDIVSLIGGTGSGKSIICAAQAAGFNVEWDGSSTIMGAMNFPLLERTSMKDLKNLFSVNGGNWNHKYVTQRPTQNKKVLELRPGKGKRISTTYFLNLENWETIKGVKADLIIIEEAPTIKKEQSLDELIGRLRSPWCPYKQIILNANPQLSGHWMFHRFKLEQFMDTYKGAPMRIGKPCRCQFCSYCLKQTKDKPSVESPWPDAVCVRCGKEDVCRRCLIRLRKRIKYDGTHCHQCGFRRCPGDQDYHRVVFSNADENPHNDSTYTETMRGGMSAHQYEMLGRGKIIESRQGKMYVSYSYKNKLEQNIELDASRPLIWSLDFNKDPMCSVIIQEYWDSDQNSHNILVQDEIIDFNSTPEAVARIFVEKYENWKGPVLIYGDPMGFNDGVKGKTKNRYEVICQVLEEYGFDYDLRVRPTRYPIVDRVDTMNWHLADGNDYIRMKFNPQCVRTLTSVEGLTWNTQANKEDEHGDRQARDSEDKSIPFIMSHPAAALGYFLLIEHPQVKWSEGAAFHMDSKGNVTTLVNGEVKEYNVNEAQDSLEDVTPDDVGLDQSSIIEMPFWGEQDLGNYLKDSGLWPDTD